jgi:hypothetical protein
VVVVPVTTPPTSPPVPVPVMMMVVMVMPMTRGNFVIVGVRRSVLALFTGRLCSLSFRPQCGRRSRAVGLREQGGGLCRGRRDRTRNGGEPKRQLEKLASFHQTNPPDKAWRSPQLVVRE